MKFLLSLWAHLLQTLSVFFPSHLHSISCHPLITYCGSHSPPCGHSHFTDVNIETQGGKGPAQGHKWWDLDMNPGLSDSKDCLLPTFLFLCLF